MRATGGRRLNAHLRRTFYLLAMGFVALVGVLAYWQVYMRESLVNNPANALQSQRARETPRGLILAGDGETVLARSERVGEESYRRVYPEGEVFANVVGYWSSRFGANGIEIGQNNNLSSTDEPETLDELINQVTGGREAGNNVTFDPGPRAAASGVRGAGQQQHRARVGGGARSADRRDPGDGQPTPPSTPTTSTRSCRSCPRTRMRRSSTARPSPCTRRARRSRS
jgi:hypothetical protein